jgi:general secretion pathway protein K
MTRARRSEQGTILIALLWIMAILGIIALSFAREAYVEVTAARNERDLIDSYYIARAGIDATVYQLSQKLFPPQGQTANLAQQEPDAIDLGKVTGSFGDGEYEVSVQDESGKVAISYAAEEEIKNLIAAIGIPSPDAETIFDSIIDWRDADNIPKPNGAENDYYAALPSPYAARNGSLTSVEELLLVRGMTPEYYFGHREKGQDGQIVERYGLSRYVTVYFNSPRINVNYAPLPVLQSVPGMLPEMALRIYERCRQRPFLTQEEFNRELGPGGGIAFLNYVGIQRGSIFTLTSYAHRTGSRARRAIRAVVSMEVQEPTKHRVLYWNENVAIF